MDPYRAHLAIATLLLALAVPAKAAEITLTTSNDTLLHREHVDDLYTATARLAVELPRYRLQLEERMFTDRNRGKRFDETYLELAREMPRLGAWHGEAGLGVLHVGRGLLGESTQNAVHRLVGSEQVELEYAGGHRFHARARVGLWRPLQTSGRLAARLYATALLAPGFDSHGVVGLETDAPIGADLRLLAGLAARVHHVENDLLQDVVAKQGAAWSLGLGWRDVVVAYGYNMYGTRTGHLMLSYRLNSSDLHRTTGALRAFRGG